MSERDELLDRLAAARPVIDSDLLEPNTNLLEEILMTDVKTPRRVVTPFRLTAIAGAAAALVAVALVLPSDHQPTLTLRNTPIAAPNMQRIADSTSAALSSGRARVLVNTKTDGDGPRHNGADFTVEFSGDDRSMFGTIDPGDPCQGATVTVPDERCGSEPFPVANKLIGGQFYLHDGDRWVEDTNAANMSGSDIFSLDPRGFVGSAAQDAAFEDVGTDVISGVQTRHLQATKLDKIPTVNLGMGPRVTPDTGLIKFEVWVDADNVVRRLLIATKDVEKSYAGARARLVKDAEGNVHKEIDPATLGEPTTITTVTVTSVTFRDIGLPIAITPPENPVKVAGKG